MSKELAEKTKIQSIVFCSSERRCGTTTILFKFANQLKKRLGGAFRPHICKETKPCELRRSTTLNDGSLDIILPYNLRDKDDVIVILVRGTNLVALNNPPKKATLLTVFRCDPPENAREIAFNCNSISIPSVENMEDMDVTLLVDRCIAILKDNCEGDV